MHIEFECCFATLLGRVVIYPVVSQEFIAFGALETSAIQTSGFHHLGASVGIVEMP